jgi:hypothetical protein
MEASENKQPLTDQTISARVPEEIIALIIAIGTDPDLSEDDPEIAALLPAPEVVAAVLAANGHLSESPVQDLDQAEAWLREQAGWQDRAMKAEAELQRRFPFGKEQALNRQVPSWMGEPWASKLLYQWAESLKDAVLGAEAFLEDNNTGATNG